MKETKDLNIDAMEEAAIKSAENHGTPDISGGFDVDEELGMVYFKDKDGHLSLTMTLEALKSFNGE